jgi:hypothetical protein
VFDFACAAGCPEPDVDELELEEDGEEELAEDGEEPEEEPEEAPAEEPEDEGE